MVLGLGGNEGVSIVITAVDNFSKTFGVAQSKLNAFKPAGLAIAAGFAAVGVGIVGVATASVKAAIDFESAFAGVRKTVDLTADEFGVLDERLRDMTKTTPMAYTELAGIAEIAGQLGVSGVDNIETFTKTIADITKSTNLTAEQAAMDFAQFANIMKMPISDVSRLGSTIVDLGNNLATTETKITDMSMRIAGAGATLGMTEGEVVGWAAALSSMGIEAEMGGTAISKLMLNINSMVATNSGDLIKFAEVSGMATQEFRKLFAEDPSAAMQKFFNGLNKIDSEGGNVAATLEQLDITEVRLRDTVLRLSGGGDVLNSALELQKKAWEENTALSEEAEKRYATLESQIQMVKNEFMLMAVEIGERLMPIVRDKLVPFVRDQLIPTLGRIFDKIIPVVQNEVIPLIENYLIPAIGKLVDFVKWLHEGWQGLSPTMQDGIKVGLLATTVILGMVAAAAALAIVLGILASPILIIAALIGALIAVGYMWWKDWDKIKVGINNIMISIYNKVIETWNGMVNYISRSINSIINMVNDYIEEINKVAPDFLQIGLIGNVNLSEFKGQLKDFEKYIEPTFDKMDTYKYEELPQSFLPKVENITTNNITIDNLNGFNARDMAEVFQDEIGKRISLG